MSLFLDLQTDVLNLMGADSADAVTMVKSTINRYHRQLLAVTKNDEEVRDFSITTGVVERLGLPLDVKRILDIKNVTQRDSLRQMSRMAYNRRYPGTTTTGPPRRYYIYGRYGVRVQPATAETVSFVSSSSNDATNYFARVKGRDASGRNVQEKVTLSGLVDSATSQTFLEIEEITLSKAVTTGFMGYVTVTGGTSGTEFALIPAGIAIPRHIWVGFYPIPDAATTHTVQAIMRKPDMANDDDAPSFDEDFHFLLVSGPSSEILPLVGKGELAGQKLFEYNEGLKALKAANNSTPNEILQFAEVTTGVTISDSPKIDGIDF